MKVLVQPRRPASEFSEFCVSWTVIVVGTLLAGIVFLATSLYDPVKQHLRTHRTRATALRAV